MCRKGESIFKRKDGRYEGRYIKGYNNLGKAIYGSVYAKTYNECKKKKYLMLQNKQFKQSNVKGKNETLSTMLDKWLKNKSSKIKESSAGRYYWLIENHIKPNLGNLKKHQITNEIINNYINKELNNGKLDNSGGLSVNTVYDIVLILKQVFKENKINIDIITISKSVGKGKSLYGTEKVSLIEVLKSINTLDAIGVLLSLFLGLRESEVCGLKIKDIDLENRIIHINQIITRVKTFNGKSKSKVIITTPKTKTSIRDLPIPDKLYDIIYSKVNNLNKDYYLLTGSDKYMDTRTYYNHYKKIINSLDIINHTYHDLRYTFANDCIELGMDAKTLMELLGHANVTTTLNVYVHGSMNNKRNFINKL